MTIAADLSKEEAPAQIVKEAVDKLGGDLLASRTWTVGPKLSNFGDSLVCLLGLDVLKNKPIVNKYQILVIKLFHILEPDAFINKFHK